MKKCTICKEVKQIKDFYANGPSYIKSECKICSSIYQRNYYADNIKLPQSVVDEGRVAIRDFKFTILKLNLLSYWKSEAFAVHKNLQNGVSYESR